MVCLAKTGKTLVTECKKVDTFWQRLKGLIGSKRNSDLGLLIKSCTSVHTCFMSYPIDIVFLNSRNTVIDIHRNISPFKLIHCHTKKKEISVLECVGGVCNKVKLGDTLVIEKNC